MMGITANDQIMSDLVATKNKDQQESAQAFSLQQQKTVPSENSGTHLARSPRLSCAVKVGEKRQRNEYCGSLSTENRSKSKDVGSSRRVSNDDGEDFGSGKQLHEVNLCKETLPNAMNRNGQLNRKQGAQVVAAVGMSQNLDTSSEVAVQPESYDCADPKFNDFDMVRENANFAVGQTWALYDRTDGMPRLYAQIRKVSVPSFGLRITYLEPDPDDDKEIQWFEEDLPVSAGKFRLGKNENTKDLSIFSHVIQCNGGSNTGQFIVFPRKGETWALFKNWDIKWSLEPDSHRNYEYEFVEILSDYSDETGVFVSYLHKAKGFASVFFRMGTGPADIFRIYSLYQFSHSVPSFKLTGTEGKGVPKDAYELDQAALPLTVEEIMVPSNSDCNRKPKRQDIYFASKGKVFQTGQIWSFYSGYDELPLYYGKIQKITFTQAFKQEAVFKLHIGRLKATPFPVDVIEWEHKKMPVGCGTFYTRKALEIISPSHVSHQVLPQISMDGTEYTILPKIGEVWVIYRYWSSDLDIEDSDFGYNEYDIVEILDDTLDYKVLLLEHQSAYGDDKDEYMLFRAVKGFKYHGEDDDGSEPIFMIPKRKRLRFSNKVAASRVTREIDGELQSISVSISRRMGRNQYLRSQSRKGSDSRIRFLLPL